MHLAVFIQTKKQKLVKSKCNGVPEIYLSRTKQLIVFYENPMFKYRKPDMNRNILMHSPMQMNIWTKGETNISQLELLIISKHTLEFTYHVLESWYQTNPKNQKSCRRERDFWSALLGLAKVMVLKMMHGSYHIIIIS